MLTASAVAFVIVTEEFPAIHRGWAIGMLGALSSCGNGLGAALFAAIDSLPYGWRSLYVVGLVPLLLVPLLRRRVPETRALHQPPRRRAGARTRRRRARRLVPAVGRAWRGSIPAARSASPSSAA